MTAISERRCEKADFRGSIPKYMNISVSEHINELFDSYDLFAGNCKERIRSSIMNKFPDLPEKEIKAAENYLGLLFEYCVKYADLLAEKYKTPFLPEGEEAQKEISEYVSECQKQYPEIDTKHIVNIFSAVCWLTNR